MRAGFSSFFLENQGAAGGGAPPPPPRGGGGGPRGAGFFFFFRETGGAAGRLSLGRQRGGVPIRLGGGGAPPHLSIHFSALNHNTLMY